MVQHPHVWAKINGINNSLVRVSVIRNVINALCQDLGVPVNACYSCGIIGLRRSYPGNVNTMAVPPETCICGGNFIL